MWKIFTETQIELAVSDRKITDEDLDAEFVTYENKYMNINVIAERLLSNRIRQTETNGNLNPRVSAPDNQRGNESNTGNFIRLPKIELPTFSGAYNEWYPFFDTFNSLINSNNQLNDIQRFYYLKSSLKGEAA